MKKLFIILVLSSCTLSPDYEQPIVAAPNNWSMGDAANNTQVAADWWKKFGSDELNELVEKSLAQNNDLQASLARIDQARAVAKIAGSNLYPQLGATGGISKDIQSRNRTTNYDSSYDAGLSLSYEIDLWGKNHSKERAAETRATAQKFDHDALALVTSSETARVYVQYLSTLDRITYASENLNNLAQVEKIADSRFTAGRTSGLDLAQQRTLLANAKSSLASLEQISNELKNQLAVLTGAAPQDFALKATTMAGLKIPQIAAGQPSELLQIRPDIRRDEENLIAANIDIGTARAAYFPSINIGIDTLIGAQPLDAPVGILTGLAASVNAPIFTGGALEGGVEQSRALKEELISAYRASVLNSFAEVENALSAVKNTNARNDSSKDAVMQSQKAYDISKARYDIGQVDFVTFLESQRSLLQAQDNIASSNYDMIAASIDLYRALGGGWKE